MTTTENYGLKKPDGSDYASVGDINDNMDAIDKELKSQSAHADRMDNPHSVTKSQVGLGNVPNVATNDQTPTYSAASTLATLVSGEKLSVSMGKIMKAITDFISHKSNVSNPHNVTKSQLGLGSVDNTADADKTVKSASTCTGNAATATKLATARTIQTNLASTSAASFDGSANVTPGVKGTLPIANGGTGATTAEKALKALGILVELAKYLPLTGGILSGNIYIKKNDDYVGGFYLNPGDHTFFDSRLEDDLGGLVYVRLQSKYKGVDLDLYKKIALMVKSPDATAATSYYLFGQHNKPSGIYTGNGSSTSRTISLGVDITSHLISRGVLITSSNGMAIVCSSSSLESNGSVVTALPYKSVHIANSVLVMATTNERLNASGITYTWQVL